MEETTKRRKPKRLPDENLDGYQGALRALVDRPWCASRAFKDQLAFMDVTPFDDELADFVRKLVARCRKMGIPMLAEAHQPCLAYVYHAVRDGELPRKAWEVVGHLGIEINSQYNLGVVWGGLECPHYWRSGWLPGEDSSKVFPDPKQHVPF